MRLALLLLLTSSVAHADPRTDCAAERKRAVALRGVLSSVTDATPEYRAMMLRRIQDAESAANACERAAADQKRAEDARQAALSARRLEEHRKAVAERFAVEELKSQPEFLKIVWSAYECAFERDREVVASNPFASPEEQEKLHKTDAEIAKIRGVMKRGKLAQLSCRRDEVAKLAFCLADTTSNAACARDEMAHMVQAQREIVEAGQVIASDVPLRPRQARSDGVDSDEDAIMTPKF